MDGDKRSGGFTLVELLVVVTILGILTAVVVFAVGGSTDKAQESACTAEKTTLETALEAYRASAGSYPTDIGQLTDKADGFLRSAPVWYQLNGAADPGGISRTDAGVAKKCPAVTP